MADPAALGGALRAFLCDELRLADAEIGDDTELFSAGRIDSADLVRLATFLERATGLRIPDDDINVDHFDSVAKILEYVAAREAGAGGS